MPELEIGKRYRIDVSGEEIGPVRLAEITPTEATFVGTYDATGGRDVYSLTNEWMVEHPPKRCEFININRPTCGIGNWSDESDV